MGKSGKRVNSRLEDNFLQKWLLPHFRYVRRNSGKEELKAEPGVKEA